MTYNTNSTNPKKLTDADLANVAGGLWNIEREEEWEAKYQSLKDRGVSNIPDYEEWLYGKLDDYDAHAIESRKAWVAAGCPKDCAIM